MDRELESAAQPSGLTRYAIDPITRVEGHGKVTLLLDEERKVQQARLHIVEFRGFEKFIQRRPYTEVPVLVWGDTGVPYGEVVAVMVALQEAGAPSVGLVTEDPE